MELVTYTHTHQEWVYIFFDIYEEEASVKIPHLDVLYERFQLKWHLDMMDFLLTNRDAWKLTDKDLEHLEEKLAELGFHCPSFDQIHALINLDRLVYMAVDGAVMNGTVTNLW